MDVSIQKPRLLYSKCRDDDEFWASLIEKAYAKLQDDMEAGKFYRFKKHKRAKVCKNGNYYCRGL